MFSMQFFRTIIISITQHTMKNENWTLHEPNERTTKKKCEAQIV